MTSKVKNKFWGWFGGICLAVFALVFWWNMPSFPARGSAENPEFVQETYTMGPMTIVSWESRFGDGAIDRLYDEQTHVACYQRDGKPLGCTTLDMGILPEEMKTGKDIRSEYLEEPIQESHHMWQEGAPDAPVETTKDKL